MCMTLDNTVNVIVAAEKFSTECNSCFTHWSQLIEMQRFHSIQTMFKWIRYNIFSLFLLSLSLPPISRPPTLSHLLPLWINQKLYCMIILKLLHLFLTEYSTVLIYSHQLMRFLKNMYSRPEFFSIAAQKVQCFFHKRITI